jgi:hypothetical protein
VVADGRASMTIEVRLRRLWAWVITDDGARWAFRAVLLACIPAFYVIGRRQWFIRDDWAFTITRELMLDSFGWRHWLFDAQDGHLLAIPIVIYHLTSNWFGLDSYWPFMIPTMLAHVGAVLLARQVCRRLHVSAWTTTIVCSMLLLFGSGWDNIVFAIQICYNLSLVCFLAQILLVDHSGAANRRDWVAAGVGIVGVLSSGFAPVFMAGVFVFLFLRRRWTAMAIVVIPQALLYGAWLVTWASDPVADKVPGPRVLVPSYLARGVSATFEAMVAIPALAGIAVVGTLLVTVWRGNSWLARSTMIALWVTVVVMFVGIGFERIGFGVNSAGSSRYVHVAAIVIAPAFAVVIDRLAHPHAELRWVARAILILALFVNAGTLQVNAQQWARDARAEQRLFELVAGSDQLALADPLRSLSTYSPDVRVRSIPSMIADGAIVPRVPTTPEELALVAAALGLTPTG